MQPTLVREPFHRDGWVYEEKLDGWRIMACKDTGNGPKRAWYTPVSPPKIVGAPKMVGPVVVVSDHVRLTSHRDS